MISCKRAAELISLSLETPLTWRQRLALSFHLFFCDMCRRFRRQSRLVQQAGPEAGRPEQMPGREETALSEEARERIKRALRNSSGGAAGGTTG
jgi:DNA-directed RNA polymerase specialized sigma24 family protein